MNNNIKKAPVNFLGRSVVFSAFYADVLFLLQISDYHHLNQYDFNVRMDDGRAKR